MSECNNYSCENEAKHKVFRPEGYKRFLCCECYIKEGNPPADFHPECMEADKKINKSTPKEIELKLNVRDCIMDARMGNVNLGESCKFIFEQMKEHTAQTLDRLESMVESVPVEGGFASPKSFKESVLQLIKEVSDEHMD